MHIIATDEPLDNGARWSFDGNVEKPTFNPSIRISYNGPDADAQRDSGRRAPSACCHYHLHAGELRFCGDCTHALSGKTVPLPPLPEHLRDPT